MRVAFLNVWTSTSAEAQGGEMLRIAGQNVGIEVIPCFNNQEVEACKPDYVLVNSRTQAKLTGYPTYLCLNEPSTVYFRDPRLLHYLYSFDGYFSISESLQTFAQHALYGVGRIEKILPYFNTAQRMNMDSVPVKEALLSKTAKVSYFGTNWDGRRIDFFRSFGTWENAEIYGPETSWTQYQLPSYKGSTPFDGSSAQKIYRKNGIGLNILADHHLQEDVISNRIFEIASVGAVVFSCRMPWLEKHFGDSLYYFEQETSNKVLLEQIKALHAHVLNHPDEAWEKAQRARKIFEDKFTLDTLLSNTLRLHKEKQEAIKLQNEKSAPLISVIIKSDGARPEMLSRAVESIKKQDAGRFQLILVKTKPFNFTPPLSSNLTLYTVDGNSLWDAFSLVKGSHFAVLREEDEWFPQHIRRLLQQAEAGYFVHCAQVTEYETAATEQNWIKNDERRAVSHQQDLKDKDFQTALELLTPSGYLAPSAILDERMRQNPNLQKGEEKALMMELLARATPRQNFATTVLVRKKDQRAQENLTALENTLFMLRHWRSNPHTGVPNRLWDNMVDLGHRARAYRYETGRSEENGVIVDRLKINRFDAARLKPMPLPCIREKSFFQLGMRLENENDYTISIASGEHMRGVGTFIAFPQQVDGVLTTEYLLLIEMQIEAGQIGIHLLQNEHTLERYNVARSFPAPRSYRLELPVYYRPEITGLAIETSPGTKGLIKSIRAYEEV